MTSGAQSRHAGAPAAGARTGGHGRARERNSAYPDTAYGVAQHPGGAGERAAWAAGEEAGTVQTASGLLFLTGLWLVVAPWVLDYERAGGVTYPEVAIGAALVAVATLRLALPLSTRRLTWAAFVLGACAICAPFLAVYPLGFDHLRPLWNEILCGSLALGLAAWSTAAEDRAPLGPAPHRPPRR